MYNGRAFDDDRRDERTSAPHRRHAMTPHDALERAADSLAEAIDDEYGHLPSRFRLEQTHGVRVGGAIYDLVRSPRSTVGPDDSGILTFDDDGPSYDDVEDAGLDGTGRNGDPRFPYVQADIDAAVAERARLAAMGVPDDVITMNLRDPRF
jgi:hypothetical protein